MNGDVMKFGQFVYLCDTEKNTIEFAVEKIINSFEESEYFNTTFNRTTDYRIHVHAGTFLPPICAVSFEATLKPGIEALSNYYGESIAYQMKHTVKFDLL